MSCKAANFTDNNDGTVTDKRTGLIWLKDANPTNKKTWDEAVNYCQNLSSGTAGLSDGSVAGDWRLPTLTELEALGTNPPITWENGDSPTTWSKPGKRFTNVQSVYWSFTSNLRGDACKTEWFINIYTGYVDQTSYCDSYDNDTASRYSVWPVR